MKHRVLLTAIIVFCFVPPILGMNGFFEDFEGGGDEWGNDSQADWTIEDGTLNGYMSPDQTSRSFVWPEHLLFANGVIDFKVRGDVEEVYSTLHCGVQFRGHYWLYVDIWNNIRLTTSNGDVLAANNEFAPMNHRWYHIQLWIEGSKFTVYADDIKVLECVDYTWDSGQFSLFMYKWDWDEPGAVTSRFDDLRITNVDGGSLLLRQNYDYFFGGREFDFKAELLSQGGTAAVDLYVILDLNCAGLENPYYFYPTWTTQLDYKRLELPADQKHVEQIFNFIWPHGVNGSLSGIYWWGAITVPDTYYLIDYSFIEWGYGP
jgi:hypothetical protein